MKNYTIKRILFLLLLTGGWVIGNSTNCNNISVSIKGDTIGCASVTLTASGSGGNSGFAYSWSGGANTGNAENTFSSSNTYTVTLTDDSSCTATASAVVTVHSNPAPLISGPASGCSPISLTASGGSSYAWSGGANTSSATNSITSSGTYTVTVTDNNHCTATKSANENVLATPSALITPGGPSSFCSGGSVLLTAPSIGNALSFTGGQVTAHPASALSTGSFTIEAWIFPTDTTPGTIISQSGSGTSYSFKVNSNGSGSLEFVVNGVDSVGGVVGLIQNQWQHVAVSVIRGGSGNLTKLYIDGTAVDSGNIVNTALNDTTLNIGKSTGAALSGAIDELRIWNTALTQSEIQGSMYATVPSNSPNLVNCYRFDEGTGTTTTDTAGSANGTLSGNVGWQTPSSAPVGEVGSPLLYNWSTGSLAEATEATTAATYSVIVTNSGDNCSAGATFLVSEDTTPNASIDSIGSLCPGSNLSLTANGAGFYSWSGPNGFTSAQQNATLNGVTSAASGQYTVTVTNSFNCQKTASINVVVSSAPNAIAQSNSPQCLGSSMTLIASGGISYIWSGPNGFSSSEGDTTVIGVTSAVTGTYQVTVTGYNGCTATTSVYDTVNALPVITATSNGPVCPGATLTVNASGGVSYTWTGPNGFSSSNGMDSVTSVTSASAGTYSVTATDVNGCSATDTVSAIVNSPVAISAGSNSPICVGATLTLTEDSAEASYAWSGPTGFTSSSQDTSINNATSAANGVYTITITDANGCSASASTTVSVNSPPAAPNASNSGPVCSGSSLTLTASSATSYSWSGPNSFSSSEQNPVIGITSAADSGTYSVTVTTSGCSATATTTASVLATPVATDSSNAVGTQCAGENIYLFSSGGGTYQWSGPLGFSTAYQYPVITGASAAATGIYTVVVTGANGCYASASTSITVIDVPAVAIAGLSDTICAGQTLDLSADGGASYSWTGPNGFTSIHKDTTITNITPAAAGTYTVTATNAGGCSASASTIIAVNVLPVITFCPGNMTVNADNGECSAVVNFAATATGTPSPVIWYSQNPGTVFPLGTTTVLVNAYNGCGSATCTFIITVVDNQPPAITCPSNIAVLANEATNTQTLSIPAPVVTDNCGVASIVNNFNGTANASGTYPAGSTSIVWTATDVNGNTSTCTQTITVYPHLVLSGTATNTLCPGTFFGSVTTLVAGGQGHYSYDWNNGSTSANLSNLAAGNYTLTVTDGASDVVTETFTVETIIPVSAPGIPGPIIGPAFVCPGATASYSIAAVPNTVSYYWTVPNNSIILTGQGTTQVTVQFPSNCLGGFVQVAAVNCAGSSNNCNGVDVDLITTPSKPGSIQGSSYVCASGSVYQYFVNPNNSNYPVTYNWTAPANASVISGQGTNMVSIKFAAGYTSGNIGVNASDCAGTSSSQSLGVAVSTHAPGAMNDIDVYSTTGDIEPTGVCPGDTVSYTVLQDNPAAYVATYNWTAPANSTIISGQGTQVITIAYLAGYNGGNISVYGSNCIGNGLSAVQNIPLNNQVPSSPGNCNQIYGDGYQNTACPGDTLIYSINAVNNARSYTWTLPANTNLVSGQGTNMIEFVVQPAFSGGNLSVYASNCAGNSNTSIQFIDISNLPGQPGNIQGPNAICPGIVYNYNASPANGDVENYVWTVPAGGTIVSGQGTSSIAIIYQNGFSGGTISICASNCIGNGASSTQQVNAQNQVPFCPNIIGSNNECIGDTAIYIALWANGALSYTWTAPAHATIISGQGSTSVAVVFNTGFTGGKISTYASNCVGNSSTALANISHNNCGTHGGDPTTGIDDNTLSDFNALVYPNPFSGQFYLKINTSDNEPVDLKIYDITGKIVEQNENVSYQEEIVLGNSLQSGVYLVQVKQGDNSKVLRIIKTE